MGVDLEYYERRYKSYSKWRFKSSRCKTLHPGFPTDMQSQMMALLLTANGHKVITETVLKIDLCTLQNLEE